jgi:ribosomal protein S18 acetylase RimI-like enzyme
MIMKNHIYLVAISDAELVEYRHQVIAEYATESAEAGRIPQNGAMEWSETETDKLLPEGNSTKDTYILKIMSHDLPNCILGYIWSARDNNNPNNAFIYDVKVLPEYQGRGIGTAALYQLDAFLKQRGYKAVGLHVYATNETAQTLYRKCGYKPISHFLRKDLR